jgi:hypothetical protein
MLKVKFGMPERASGEMLETRDLGVANPHCAILIINSMA